MSRGYTIYVLCSTPYSAMHTTTNDQTSYDDSRVSAQLIVRVSRATWLGPFLLISYCCIEEIRFLLRLGIV